MRLNDIQKAVLLLAHGNMQPLQLFSIHAYVHSATTCNLPPVKWTLEVPPDTEHHRHRVGWHTDGNRHLHVSALAGVSDHGT